VHATALNTKHRTDDADRRAAGGRGGGRRQPVDVRAIVPAYAQHTLGTVRAEGLHLSRLGPRTPDGYFANDAVVSFP
jgi:hypothetical protein